MSGLNAKRTATPLSEFGRTIRDEPFFYVFKHKLFVTAEKVPAPVVTAWLKNRYAQNKAGHRFRIVNYKHADGSYYVDYILMETCTDNDLVYMKLQGWGWSQHKVKRGNRYPRKKLTKVQRAALKARLAAVEQEFYDALDASN